LPAARGRPLEHVLPNILNTLIVQATIQLARRLPRRPLSYFGLASQPPAPSWGKMLADAQTLIEIAPPAGRHSRPRSGDPKLR
jgi:peptide/nickel transport system permease protein